MRPAVSKNRYVWVPGPSRRRRRAAPTRRNPLAMRGSPWRGLESNRRHDDFQYFARKSLTSRNPCSGSGFRARPIKARIAVICELVVADWVPDRCEYPMRPARSHPRPGVDRSSLEWRRAGCRQRAIRTRCTGAPSGAARGPRTGARVVPPRTPSRARRRARTRENLARFQRECC